MSMLLLTIRLCGPEALAAAISAAVPRGTT